MRWAILLVSALTVLRLVVAAGIPLTGDEAYYWSWSRHLAFGYTDHPPLVAWLIALGTLVSGAPLGVRLPFVLCEAVAALAVGRAAWLLSGSERAGAIATIGFALIPQIKLAIGEALPDGPFMAAWALTLWAATAFERTPTRRGALLLGAAMAAAVLSRWFGWALVFGIACWSLGAHRRALWNGGMLLALALPIAAFVPVLVWNASVGWENVAFTFHDRQALDSIAVTHAGNVSSIRFLIYALAIVALTWLVALRSSPRLPLLAWTALPLPIAFIALAFVTTIESYWIIGPGTSLLAAAGIALARANPRWTYVLGIVFGAAAAYTMAAALFLVLPEPLQQRFFSGPGATLRGPLASGVYEYPALSERVRRDAAADAPTILVDQFSTAAELAYAGIDARLVGFTPQVPQWARWHRGSPVASRALVLTLAHPLRDDPALAARITAAYERCQPERTLPFAYAGVPEATFYETACAGLRPDAARVLPGL
jgi:hypothetical protein